MVQPASPASEPRTRRRRYDGPERRTIKLSPPAIGLAALVLAGIAFATLCPQSMRPHLASADVERFGAYFLLGLCTSFAFPRHGAAVVFGVAIVAFGLEAGQLLVPGRDAVFSDACVKAMGGVWGAFACQSSYALKRKLFPDRRKRRRVSASHMAAARVNARA